MKKRPFRMTKQLVFRMTPVVRQALGEMVEREGFSNMSQAIRYLVLSRAEDMGYAGLGRRRDRDKAELAGSAGDDTLQKGCGDEAPLTHPTG